LLLEGNEAYSEYYHHPPVRRIPGLVIHIHTVIDSVPVALQTKRTEVNDHLRNRIVAAKVRALATKAERPAAAATTHSSQEKGTNTSVQIKTLTDLVKALVRAIEDQKQAH
jgi:hypothetical protein